MAVNVFDKYGLKEVANVYFEALEDDPKAKVYAGDIVLFLDSLKVSTIETTAETADSRGGWGNPKLISWDYGKELSVTLTDALLSLESLRFMLGGAINRSASGKKVIVQHSEEVTAVAVSGSNTAKVPFPKDHLTGEYLNPFAKKGTNVRFINYGKVNGTSETAGCRTQVIVDDPVTVGSSSDDTYASLDNATFELKFSNSAMGISEKAPEAGDHIRIFWEEEVEAEDAAVEVVISPSTFPGTYKVVGDTFMRSEKTGKDEAFQFIINKAKVASNVTLTLEAEGDPSTFEMTLNVLRSTGKDGDEMMRLVRYGGASADDNASDKDIGSITGVSKIGE